MASAFIPRCAARFPDKIEAAVSSLMDLSISTAKQESETAFADASCLSALQGLGTLCKAAARAGQEKPISNGVEFLLRYVLFLVNHSYTHKLGIPAFRTNLKDLS